MPTRIIKAVAWGDFAVTLPFAVPFIAEALIALIYGIDRALGFDTPALFFEAGPFGLMFVHIMGVLGVVWAAARLRQPLPELARIDAVARLVVAALIIYAISMGATPLLWLFVATEIGGSILQFAGLGKS